MLSPVLTDSRPDTELQVLVEDDVVVLFADIASLLEFLVLALGIDSEG